MVPESELSARRTDSRPWRWKSVMPNHNNPFRWIVLILLVCASCAHHGRVRVRHFPKSSQRTELPRFYVPASPVARASTSDPLPQHKPSAESVLVSPVTPRSTSRSQLQPSQSVATPMSDSDMEWAAGVVAGVHTGATISDADIQRAEQILGITIHHN